MQEQTELVKEGTVLLELRLYAEILLFDNILLQKGGESWYKHWN